MTFEKITEIIHRVDNYGGFLILRTLKPSEELLSVSDKEVIENIIQSKYHHWQGEKEPNGITIIMNITNENGKSNNQTLTGHKFYGFFDNSKITEEHYKNLEFENFYNQILKKIEIETNKNEEFLKLAKNTIENNLTEKSTYYELDIDQEKNMDLISEWHVYSFFYAFISLDKENNNINLIEFGLD